MNEIRSHWKKWIYWFVFAVAVIIVYKAFDNFTDVVNAISTFFGVIAPFFVGIFIAYLLFLPCRKIEGHLNKSKFKFVKSKSRVLSVAIVYVITLLLIVILIMFIFPIILQGVRDLIVNIPTYFDQTVQRINALPEDSFIKSDAMNQMLETLKNFDIKQYFQLEKIIEYVSSAISAVFSIVDIFIAVIVSIYILVERTQILNFLRKFVYAVFPKKTYYGIEKYFHSSNEIFFRFITSQFLDAIIVGILVTIALLIMGVKYAPVLGFFIGLFNMIPYFGAIIATVISAIIVWITGGLSQVIWMLIVVIILQQIDANIINPKIVGKSLKISPLLVIFSVTVGGAFFGVFGMFVAVPIIAIIKILVEDYVDYKLATKEMEIEGKD